MTLRYWLVCWKFHPPHFIARYKLCCMYSASVKHQWPCTQWLYQCFYTLACLWYLLFHSHGCSTHCLFMSGFFYLFSWIQCYFYSPSALFFMLVYGSPSVTHFSTGSLYTHLWLSTSLVWNLLVHVLFSSHHFTLVSSFTLAPISLVSPWVFSLPPFQILFHTK